MFVQIVHVCSNSMVRFVLDHKTCISAAILPAAILPCRRIAALGLKMMEDLVAEHEEEAEFCHEWDSKMIDDLVAERKKDQFGCQNYICVNMTLRILTWQHLRRFKSHNRHLRLCTSELRSLQFVFIHVHLR